MDTGGLGEPISVSTHRMEEGRPLGEFYGLKSVGVSENGLFLIEKPDGEQWELEIEKDYEEDLGLHFEQGLMDEYRPVGTNAYSVLLIRCQRG